MNISPNPEFRNKKYLKSDEKEGSDVNYLKN